MSDHRTGTRDEWLAARVELLEREKELTRQSDELARQRQELPWVQVDEDYRFQTEAGERTLAELFDGCSQLLVFHLMYGPEDELPCIGCSYHGDSFDRAVAHLPDHDVRFVAVSRGPLDKLLAYKRRIGWSFPWVSAEGNDFSLDFSVFTDQGRRDGTGFNFGTAKNAGIDLRSVELHGLSAFALQDGIVHHTYSTYDRGTDVLNVDWQLLDRAPRGRGGDFGGWPRRRYEYELVTEWGQTPL
jgi:predicted dithiol-disulfide oxidoreductase (DUF899 family)